MNSNKQFLILLSLIIYTGLTQAQVATAPLVPDQRLVNPAALAYRVLRGYSLNLHREVLNQKAPAAASESLQIDTQVDTLALNFGWGKAPYFFETNLLPQTGKRQIKSVYKESSGQSSTADASREIKLIPVQALVAARLGSFGSVGAKALYTNSKFSVNEKYGFSYDYGSGLSTGTHETTGDRSASFFTGSMGGVLNLLNTGLYFGFSSEYFMLKDELNAQNKDSMTTSSGTNASSQTKNQNVTTTLRKDILGIGYLTKFAGNNTWRIDLSQERMPAMDNVPSYGAEPVTEGKLTRLVTEATWSYFQAGVQVTSTSGFYVDPYNLIPYYFSTGVYSNDEVLEYGFFGGLKSSKGHSFSLSYSQSSETKKENLGGSSPVALKSKQLAFGLSYMFLF